MEKVIIETGKTEEGYSCSCALLPGWVAAYTGDFEGFRKYVQESIDFYIDCAREDGREYPRAFDGEYELVMQEKSTVRQVLASVYEDINWAYLAKNYFGKSRSWLYHKFSGMNNGKADDFSDIDRERLKGALVDIADRLRQTADRL